MARALSFSQNLGCSLRREYWATKDCKGSLRPNGGSVIFWILQYVQTDYETYAVPV